MSTEDRMHGLLSELRATAESWEVEEPHALIETDPVTGHQQVTGPFADGWAAARAAVELENRNPQNHDKPYPTFKVVLYFTPQQYGLGK